jgi:hypothetical protein
MNNKKKEFVLNQDMQGQIPSSPLATSETLSKSFEIFNTGFTGE